MKSFNQLVSEVTDDKVIKVTSLRNGIQVDTYHDNYGQKHRVDGPAVVATNPEERKLYIQEWWRHGDRHRIGGPAAIFPSGVQWWYVNGRLHRLDGPAVVDPHTVSTSGNMDASRYFIHGKEYPREEFLDLVKNIPIEDRETYIDGLEV